MIKGGLSLYQFEFHNPVRVFFGKDELCHLPTVIKQYGGKVLVLYSDSFRRNSSYYDEIINILNSEDVETIECCGIMAIHVLMLLIGLLSCVENQRLNCYLRWVEVPLWIAPRQYLQ